MLLEPQEGVTVWRPPISTETRTLVDYILNIVPILNRTLDERITSPIL
jgi:hypothetical protein